MRYKSSNETVQALLLLIANQDLAGIVYDASMVHAFVIPNQACPLATFEIDAEENSILDSKVCVQCPSSDRFHSIRSTTAWFVAASN